MKGNDAHSRRFNDIVTQIELMIDTGEVEIGAMLPSEREMMARFEVGRPTIREALFTLQQRGRIQVVNGSRARVVEVTAKFLFQQMNGGVLHMLSRDGGQQHLDGARQLFETGLARYAALHRTDEDLAHIERALERNRISVGRPLIFQRTDCDFHHAISLVPKNPVFPALQQAMYDWLAGQRTVNVEMPDAEEISYCDHATLFKAIADRDPDRAEQVMRDHLSFVSEVYQAVKHASRAIVRDITRSIVKQVVGQCEEEPAPEAKRRKAARRQASQA